MDTDSGSDSPIIMPSVDTECLQVESDPDVVYNLEALDMYDGADYTPQTSMKFHDFFFGATRTTLWYP